MDYWQTIGMWKAMKTEVVLSPALGWRSLQKNSWMRMVGFWRQAGAGSKRMSRERRKHDMWDASCMEKWCLREEKRTGKMKIVKTASQRFINALLPSHTCWNMHFQPSQAYRIGLDRPNRVQCRKLWTMKQETWILLLPPLLIFWVTAIYITYLTFALKSTTVMTSVVVYDTHY